MASDNLWLDKTPPQRATPYAGVDAFGTVIQADFSEALKKIRVFNIKKMREQFMQRAEAALAQTWERAVSGHTLKGMSYAVNDANYARAIQNAYLTRSGGNTISIEVDYEKIWEYEDGYSDYDMKPGFLAHAKHISKDGDAYVVVPFRHLTPNQTNEGIHAATVMPVEVYDIAQDMRDYDDFLEDDSEPITKPRLDSMSDTYTHTESIYNKMRKYPLKSLKGKRLGSQYLTFRTVSEKSDENSWHHPGKPQNPIIDAVCTRLRDVELPNIMLGYIGAR